jgi:uncharacterized protein YkwD
LLNKPAEGKIASKLCILAARDLSYLIKFLPMTITGLTPRALYFCFSFACILGLTAAIVHSDGLNDDVLKYTNQFRKSKHLPSLEMREDLNAIAQKHSEYMAKGERKFGHDGFNQREAEVQKIIQPFSEMAENVAYGATTGKEVVEMWKDSPGHRKNMLGNYKYMGIGTDSDGHGTIYFTAIFVR